MTGLEFLDALPTWTLAAVIIGGSVIFSVGLQLLVRWRFGAAYIASNHEVAGFKYAVVGVAYAVLLAFVVVGVWEQYEDTDDAAQAEAERFYNLFRHSYNYPPAAGEEIRTRLLSYAMAVRDSDWPEMERGRRGSDEAAAAYAKLSYTIGQTKSDDIAMLPTILHGIDLLKEMADLRLDRLSDVGGHMTPVIWGVLILGGLITLAYPAFFATHRVTPQVLMTAGLAMIVGAIFFLTIDLNFPFTGQAHIKPGAIDEVIQRMKTEGPVGNE
ncbi:MAG: DUF4239 domain-containing protein [Methyloceanibacter sp.]|nr:DUF4239 domain-containing protein [Methyloceanibacter sp.]